MGRPLRVLHANRMAHCFIHAVDGVWFNQSDIEIFMAVLRTLVARHKYRIVFFTIMSNHVHWVMEFTENENCGHIEGNIHTCLSKAYNGKHGRKGHMWRERYKDVTIQEDSHFLSTIAYVALNKLKAGAIQSIEEDWSSSYQAWAYGIDDGITTLPAIYETLGRTPEERQQGFRQLIDDVWRAYVDQRTWERIEDGEDVFASQKNINMADIAQMFVHEEEILKRIRERNQRARARQGRIRAFTRQALQAQQSALRRIHEARVKLMKSLAGKGVPKSSLNRFWAQEDFIVDFVSDYYWCFNLSGPPLSSA